MSAHKVTGQVRQSVVEEYDKFKSFKIVGGLLNLSPTTVASIVKSQFPGWTPCRPQRAEKAFGNGTNSMDGIRKNKTLNDDGSKKPAHVIERDAVSRENAKLSAGMSFTRSTVVLDKGVCYACQTSDGLIRAAV